MAKEEGSDESLELSVWTWFKLRVPAIIILALFGDAARTKRKLRVLSESGTEKALAGQALTEDEQLVHDLDMARSRKEHQRLLESGARAAQIIAQEPKLLPGHVEGQPTPEPQVTSEGWSDRYREGAKLHAEPDVREMWSRILAGEVTKPGSFSFKTLSVLKDTDTESAHAFVRFLAFTFTCDGAAAPSAEEFAEAYERAGLNYTTLLRLEELGLANISAISAIKAVSLPLQLNCARYGFSLPAPKGGKVRIQTLTRAGAELRAVADVRQTASVMLAQVEWLQRQHGRVDVGIPTGRLNEFLLKEWSPGLVVFDDATGEARFA